ncbi:MAG TPA: CbtB-domain containing protein [Acidimicrobiales bacterium]|jgi:hypothetical protein
MDTPAAAAPVEATDAVGAPTIARIPTWALIGLLAFAAGIVWLIAFDNGQASAMADSTGTFLHEFFHDARHSSGAPCH